MTSTYCIEVLQVCEVHSCVPVVWLIVFSKVDENVSFLIWRAFYFMPFL